MKKLTPVFCLAICLCLLFSSCASHAVKCPSFSKAESPKHEEIIDQQFRFQNVDLEGEEEAIN